MPSSHLSKLRRSFWVSSVRCLALRYGLEREHGHLAGQEGQETIEKEYGIIYADLPWKYAQKRLSGAGEHHCPAMNIEELCTLPVAGLAAESSVLSLWATFPG